LAIQEQQATWHQANARRSAVLIDAAAYFGVLRRSLLEAQQSVFIIGWDIHSETRLVDASGHARDGLPESFGAFLKALLVRRPSLRIYILVWQAPIIYAAEREWFLDHCFGANELKRIVLKRDSCLPLGSSQHQKIVVIDDRIAFVGGCDITVRRWDTDAHALRNQFRVDPSGISYPPFHDLQMVVDGDAARSIAELARKRLLGAGIADLPPPPASTADLWPAGLKPQFENIDIGIARTVPALEGRPGIREVEQLYLAMIDSAEQSIYIENQFLSADGIAARLVARMQANPRLEVLMVGPRTHASWIEARAMRNGRVEFIKAFAVAGLLERVRLLYPRVRYGDDEAAVMIHAKLMIVDDRYLRVGSANLNNRSMGADSECDLVIEAGSLKERCAIALIRNTLIGHHCGVAAAEVSEQLAQDPSLLRLAAGLSRDGHSLCDVDDGMPDPVELSGIVAPIADPRRPLNLSSTASTTLSALLKLAGVVIVIASLALGWRLTSLHNYVSFEWLSRTIEMVQGEPIAPLVVVALFLVGGLVLIPVTILIAATSAALGPWLGLASATVGALSSASMVYAIGRMMGMEPVRSLLGKRFDRFTRTIKGNGIVSVVLIRMVPVAPFSLVNLAAGATGILFSDFLIGTMLGMAPGLIAMTAFGSQLADLLARPSWSNIGILTASATAWIALSFAAQFVVTWLSRRRA
jgi:phospholipase D1/2